MSLRFNKSLGRYEYAIYTDGRKGKKIQRRLPAGIDTEQAEEIYRQALRHYHAKKAQAADLGLTISRLIRKYLSWYELHRAPKTVKDARGVFEGHVETILGGIVAEYLEQRDIQEYQKKRKDLRGSNRAVNKELAYFSGCLRWATEKGLISPRPWKIEYLPYVRPIPQILTVHEVARLLKCAEPYYRPLFILFYAVGLRLSEAINIRWGDIDEASGTLTLKQKGGSFKRLPFPPALLTALKKIARPGADSKNVEGFVFWNPGTEKPIYDGKKALKRAKEKAGITKRVHPHLLRHSFASHLMAGGVNQRVIQRLLGHADIASTSWYTHVAPENLRGASDFIAKGLKTTEKRGKSVRR